MTNEEKNAKLREARRKIVLLMDTVSQPYEVDALSDIHGCLFGLEF